LPFKCNLQRYTAVFTLPLRGLFILVSKIARLVRKLKGQTALPKMK
jgi:hypothetical protein